MQWEKKTEKTTSWLIFKLLPTVDVGLLDVHGLRGLLVARWQGAVDRGEDLQDSFGQAGLEHHAATAHAHVLAAWIQVGDAHRHWGHKGGGMETSESEGPSGL